MVDVLEVATRFTWFQEADCWDKDPWSQEGETEQIEKRKCNVKL